VSHSDKVRALIDWPNIWQIRVKYTAKNCSRTAHGIQKQKMKLHVADTSTYLLMLFSMNNETFRAQPHGL
jgi:hypothetical protein